MDLDQTQAICDYGEEEEEKDKQTEAHRKKKEVIIRMDPTQLVLVTCM